MAQSEEQRLAALQAAGLSPEQQAGVISGTTITGADLGTVSAPNFQTPTYTPPPDISGIDTATKTATELSPAEQGVSDLTKRITDIQSSLAGKTTFQQEQETTLGVPGLEAEQNDLAALIKSYQSEALNLQNQKTLAEERILQESVGRGRTAGGISPLVAGEQRKITLQQADVASRALVASAAFDVTTGKIATANAKIKRALDAKFGAKEEEVKISLANLEILLKDPALDKATKDRANAQIQIQKSKEADIETKKKEQEEIWKSVTTAAANIKNFIPTTEYPNATSAIQAMNEAKSKEEVLQIALKTGLTEKPETSGIVGEYNFYVQQEKAAGRTPVSFNEYQNIDANRKAKIAAAGTTPSTIQTYADLLAKGQISLANVPQDIRNLVVASTGGIVNKPLSDTAIKEIQQSESAVSNLTALKQIVESNLQFVGPVSGLARFNPFSKARQVQAEIDRVRQQVGKTLEGGVLRKEDEEKYKKILATLADTPETALYKIDSLISAIQRDVETYKNLQQETGRFVPGQNKTDSESLRNKYKY